MVANIIIVAIVAVLFFLCVRKFVRNGGEDCADCTVEGCNASLRRQGKCVAAEDMLKNVNKAFETGQIKRQ